MMLTRLARSVPNGVGNFLIFGIALACAGTLAAADQPLYTVLNPTGNAPPIERKAMAPRPASLSGKTVYLVDETFDGGDKFLQEMQKYMAVHMPDVKTVFREKKGSYFTDDPDLWKEIQSVHGLMVMAIGH
ncbi:MAG TPA: hypothetical protein VME17_21755 [Bryobacteraceae bacterium]|nr:hypothetical protein [Bryobacteraceae bacterium]